MVVGGWYIRRSRRRSAGEVGLNFSPHPRRPCPRTARTLNGPAHARRRAQSLGRPTRGVIVFLLCVYCFKNSSNFFNKCCIV